MELTTTALATPCRPSHGTLPEMMHPAKLSLHPGGEHFSTGLFFTAYMGIFADSGIIKDYTKGIKSMIFSSFFSKNAFDVKCEISVTLFELGSRTFTQKQVSRKIA